jgi:alpha-amylase/alpha-mannosidase (GH57 family)
MERYVCIHGHFYQPPRENAWLESIELQDSAYPYHDWNERVTAECYATNSASHILDSEDYIIRIVNNYAKISFNFGPTLISWLKNNSPEVYQAIITADQESQRNFSGHGSALAQAYNHIIMPLANRRDKYTQAQWGIRDFERHFNRKPEGMWLPETAVDLETLDIMAELGIKFTILAPHQASRTRGLSSAIWNDIKAETIDTTMAYELHLPSGRKIDLFFYQGPISRAVAFEGLLRNGEDFARRLIEAFSKQSTAQLVHIATDGETYGHHHRFADMALAYAINYIEANKLALITNYGEYLERHPPSHAVEINENTSWSCAHGIERWRSDCGCNSGIHRGWNQAWRTPLRRALDWLRDSLATKYEEKARRLLKAPWAARDDYVEIVLDRSPENVRRFLDQHANREMDETERTTALKLLELQRHAMLMYASDGWFFDDLSGIETVQTIQYAGRVIQLAEQLFKDNTESHFLNILERAKSNIPENGDGQQVYQKFVKAAMIDLAMVTAHYAVSYLFENYSKQTKINCYHVDLEDNQTFTAGKSKLAIGRAKVTSEITLEHSILSFGALCSGGYNINASVREYQGEEAYRQMVQELSEAFSKTDSPEVIRALDRHFGTSAYSLKSLFRDEQRKVLGYILESSLSEIKDAYRQLYASHFLPMRYLSGPANPVPKAFQSVADFILNTELSKSFSSNTLDVDRVKSLLEGAKTWNVTLDAEGLGYKMQQALERSWERFASAPGNVAIMGKLLDSVVLARSVPFPVDLWKLQNLYYEMLKNIYPAVRKQAQQENEALEWIKVFLSLGQRLMVRVS